MPSCSHAVRDRLESFGFGMGHPVGSLQRRLCQFTRRRPSIYSPDLNPIEQLFAKLKALLRKAASRTQTALWETIGTLLDDFAPAECQNDIANSGYEFV